MTNWRDVKCSDIDFTAVRALRNERAVATVSWHFSEKTGEQWGRLTLGELAAMGEARWKRAANVGAKGVEVIKFVIDTVASGEHDLTKAAQGGGYIPRCERK